MNKKTSPKQWQQQAERSNAFMIKLLASLALICGRGFIRLLLLPIVLYFFVSGSQAKKYSTEALYRFTGSMPSQKTLFKHLYYFAMVAVDRIFMVANKMQQYHIQFFGEALFQPLLEAKTGCVLLVSHVGSYDVMRALATRQQGLPMKILMDKHHNKAAMSLINSLDPILAEQIIDARQPPATLALELQGYLNQGYMIGIMADRAGPNEQTVVVDFAGGKAEFPLGPWLLSWVLKVPVILCVGLYRGGNRYDVYFEHLYDALHGKRQQRHDIVAAAVAHYAQRLEFYVKKAPLNWFNFYSFWHHETTTNH